MNRRHALAHLRHAAALFAILVLSGWARADDAPSAVPAPPLERAVRVLDTGAKEEVSLETLVDRLADAEVVFLGETHLDETTHRLQWHVYQSLVVKTGGKVVLAMEMFERDAQPALDAYLAGEIDEPTFLTRAGAWSNYRTDYRPMIELAKARGLPVIAANFPRSVRRKLGFGGKEAYEALTEEDKKFAPRELYDNSDDYWERFARTVRGHGGFGDFLTNPDRRMYSTQCLWDNAMGEACVDALAAHPGWVVLHLNGGFHTAYRQGTAEQVLHRRPETKVATVAIDPTSDLPLVGVDIDWDRAAERADFIAAVEDRARAVQDGTHAVTVARELEFRLSVPESATDAKPAPLVIAMPPEGLRAADEMRYWKLAFGDEAAIATIDPPFPQRGEDLYLGGEWYFEENFDSHLGALHQGLIRLVSRLVRTQPVDPERIVLVASGTAGTVVSSAMLYASDALPLTAYVVDPRRYHKLRDGGLPKPAPPRDAPGHDLVVYCGEDHTGFWDEELESYAISGLRVERRDLGNNPRLQIEAAIRTIWNAPLTSATDGAVVQRALRVDSILARHWGDLEARAMRAQGKSVRVEVRHEETREEVPTLALPGEPGAVSPSLAVADVRSAIPLCPGPFGGTTVIVIYPGTPEETIAEWEELAANDPLRLRSRFHGMRVAYLDRSPTIHEVLTEVRDGGGSNLLLVPAAYCATADEMRTLRSIVKDHLTGFSVHWSPGLGARTYNRHTRDEPKATD